MTSKTVSKSQPINFAPTAPSNETGFDFPLSPSEPGKFDFYRVHLTSQAQQKDSMFSDNYDTPNLSNEMAKTNQKWTPFSNLKHLSDQTKSSSSSSIFPPLKSATDSDIPSTTNKPIQTVASYSSLTDAVKNAMQRGNLGTGTNQLARSTNGATLSTKDLNHLSPQSM